MSLLKKFDHFAYHLKSVHGRLALLDGIIILDACAMHSFDQTHCSIFGVFVEVFLGFELEFLLV